MVARSAIFPQDREADGTAPPFALLGIGGTQRPSSSSEQALRYALQAAAVLGAATQVLTARDLDLPMYDPQIADHVEPARVLIESVRRADGIIIASPGYHGGLSGLLKNALDYLQALATDPAPYLHGKAVGCIVTASGWQGGATTLMSMRSTVHALRGWPTPLGVVINSARSPFGPDGELLDRHAAAQLTEMARQVVSFGPGMGGGDIAASRRSPAVIQG
jgi:FMN reductase